MRGSSDAAGGEKESLACSGKKGGSLQVCFGEEELRLLDEFNLSFAPDDAEALSSMSEGVRLGAIQEMARARAAKKSTADSEKRRLEEELAKKKKKKTRPAATGDETAAQPSPPSHVEGTDPAGGRDVEGPKAVDRAAFGGGEESSEEPPVRTRLRKIGKIRRVVSDGDDGGAGQRAVGAPYPTEEHLLSKALLQQGPGLPADMAEEVAEAREEALKIVATGKNAREDEQLQKDLEKTVHLFTSDEYEAAVAKGSLARSSLRQLVDRKLREARKAEIQSTKQKIVKQRAKRAKATKKYIKLQRREKKGKGPADGRLVKKQIKLQEKRVKATEKIEDLDRVMDETDRRRLSTISLPKKVLETNKRRLAAAKFVVPKKGERRRGAVGQERAGIAPTDVGVGPMVAN
jgi:hypothetical protein